MWSMSEDEDMGTQLKTRFKEKLHNELLGHLENVTNAGGYEGEDPLPGRGGCEPRYGRHSARSSYGGQPPVS